MRVLVTGLVLCGSVAAAAAQPCAVTVVRAPDAVRPVVERWLASEPACAVALQVRIVETEGGLYVIAIDADRHTFERVVPDAESAGALIASWAAATTPAPAGPATTPARPARRVAALEEDPPPSRVAPSPDGVEYVAGPSEIGFGGHDFAFGTVYALGNVDDLGLHARQVWSLHVQADLVKRGRWSWGGVVGVAYDDQGDLGMVQASVGAFTAWTTPPAAWRVRAELGAQVGHTWITGVTFPPMLEYPNLAAAGLGAVVSRQVSADWAISAGPQLSTLLNTPYAFDEIAVGLELAVRGTM